MAGIKLNLSKRDILSAFGVGDSREESMAKFSEQFPNFGVDRIVASETMDDALTELGRVTNAAARFGINAEMDSFLKQNGKAIGEAIVRKPTKQQIQFANFARDTVDEAGAAQRDIIRNAAFKQTAAPLDIEQGFFEKLRRPGDPLRPEHVRKLQLEGLRSGFVDPTAFFSNVAPEAGVNIGGQEGTVPFEQLFLQSQAKEREQLQQSGATERTRIRDAGATQRAKSREQRALNRSRNTNEIAGRLNALARTANGIGIDPEVKKLANQELKRELEFLRSRGLEPVFTPDPDEEGFKVTIKEREKTSALDDENLAEEIEQDAPEGVFETMKSFFGLGGGGGQPVPSPEVSASGRPSGQPSEVENVQADAEREGELLLQDIVDEIFELTGDDVETDRIIRSAQDLAGEDLTTLRRLALETVERLRSRASENVR